MGQSVTPTSAKRRKGKSISERAFENALATGARRCRLDRAAVLCAVSGGPDSVALLVALVRRREALGLSKLAVAHVDHGLRASSGKDAALVRKLATELGVPYLSARVRVEAAEGGIEAAARTARYLALEEMARAGEYDTVVTGHTRTDQAETVLLRLMRGSGLRGLSAMTSVRRLAPGIRLARPMLGLSGIEARAYVAMVGVATANDESNLDPRFRRNALRHQAWPALLAIEPALEKRLSELALQAREDEGALDALARAAYASLVRRSGERVSISAPALSALPEAIGRRVLRRMVARLSPLAQVSALHLRGLLALARKGRGETHVAGDLSGKVLRGKLVLQRRPRSPAR